jgi:hypothetical protein
VSVKLCFLVNVRKARGRSVAGGSSTGRMLAFVAAVVRLRGRIGWTGVPNAGDEDGMIFNGPGVGAGLNIGGARGFSTLLSRLMIAMRPRKIYSLGLRSVESSLIQSRRREDAIESRVPNTVSPTFFALPVSPSFGPHGRKVANTGNSPASLLPIN